MPNIICHNCHQASNFTPPVPRSATCPKCQEDVRCCLNCRFHDASAHRACREEQASWVKEKDRGNFCSYFSPAAAPREASAQAAAAKTGLEALFSPLALPLANGEDGGRSAKPKSGLAADLERFLGGNR